jgi:LuxR family quorum sensing-dependent transcriptional regulator
MHKTDLYRTHESIKLMDAAMSPPEVAACMLRCVARYGFDQMLAGTVPAAGQPGSAQRSHVIFDEWPKPWFERYFSCGYLDIDPTISRVRAGGAPFFWTELGKLDAPQVRIMDEASDFGLVGGLTVSLVRFDGRMAGLSISGRRVEYHPALKGMMTLLTTYAIGRCLELDGEPIVEHTCLSRREASILQWVAEGKTDWEIGEILSISEHTIDKHVRNIFAKLRANSRASAVAKAMRAKIII